MRPRAQLTCLMAAFLTISLILGITPPAHFLRCRKGTWVISRIGPARDEIVLPWGARVFYWRPTLIGPTWVCPCLEE